MRCVPIIATLSLAGCAAPPASAINGATDALRWTPDSIATSGYESTPTFSPDGSELYFIAADERFANWRIMMSICQDGNWSAPVSPSFAATAPVIEADPYFTPDGKGLYFISARHDPAGVDFDIWFVKRAGGGEWGEPARLPEPVNSRHEELLPRIDKSGRLYFGSSRPGGYGKSDIYVAKTDSSGRWIVENVGPPVSTAFGDDEAEISQDGKTMIVVSDRGDKSHLYHFKDRNGQWVEIGRIDADPNVFQVGPLLSPSGQRLLSAQADGERSGEIFLTDLVAGADEPWPPDCKN